MTSFFNPFSSPPPVPPLPDNMRSNTADDHSATIRRVDKAKPLPVAPAMSDDFKDDASLVVVESPSVNADDVATVKRNKRRSMSVSEVDLRNAMSASSAWTPLPHASERSRKETSSWNDTALKGILQDFQGELSQLDPSGPSNFSLRDPSTPVRRQDLHRVHTDTSVPTSSVTPEKAIPRSFTSPNTTPTLVLQPPGTDDNSQASSRSPNPPVTSFRQAGWKQNPSPLRARSGSGTVSHAPSASRESTKLRLQHRSTASSSEPSLIPAEDDLLRNRRNSVRLLPTSSSTTHLQGEVVTKEPIDTSDDGPDVELRGKELAYRCWIEDDEFLPKEKIAEWLGGIGRINGIALHHYLEFFDFSTLRLDGAFRRLCAKLYLKAETQQVDRILDEFSRRYWDCNPGTLYGSASVVHAVSYSLLLLNTDLHVAELTTRMSKNQFVRNTLSTINMQLHPDNKSPTIDPIHDDAFDSTPVHSEEAETITRSKRSDSITSWNSVSRDAVLGNIAGNGLRGRPSDESGPPSNGSDFKAQFYSRQWESDMEALLKEMYTAIKSQQILQPQLGSTAGRSSTSSLRPGNNNLMRNRSLRGPPDRLTTLKRGSIRGIQSILGSQASPYSSNSSFEGRVSPSPSFATSTHEALYGSSSSFLQPTLGFAFNLSNTIIREAQEDDDRSAHSGISVSTNISITDEELALLGAPWAKEGMLCRKQYWELTSKRAKDKSWTDVFVVISRGELNMFIFGDHGGSGMGVVGGGNWLENADLVGTVQLAHSLAHPLPPPGYNRQRPYCMVLTLSNGGVYFFQAGTEELVNEWVSTCNYWAARTSKEPLTGGVSNMEYGWNRVVDVSSGRNSAGKDGDTNSVRSGRSSKSRFGRRDGTVRSADSPFADKIFINDWREPLPPPVSSVHDEETQLDALQKHVSYMKEDLKRHNELREPMMTLYPPRSTNGTKAQLNWEKKSKYLLKEIVKYDSYIDSLQVAMALRLQKRGEKALERALSGNNSNERSTSPRKRGSGDTVHESEDAPGPSHKHSSNLHRREMAEDM